jgi:hypothetical protein
LPAPLVVEAVDEGRVAGKALGCGHLLEAVLFPQAPRVAERADPAFGGDPRAGQDGEPAPLPDRPGQIAQVLYGENVARGRG